MELLEENREHEWIETDNRVYKYIENNIKKLINRILLTIK